MKKQRAAKRKRITASAFKKKTRKRNFPAALSMAGKLLSIPSTKKKRKNWFEGCKKNPPKPVEIYGRLIRLEAQKGPGHACDAECKKANHCYYHDFSRHARVFGMPDGSLRIVDKT